MNDMRPGNMMTVREVADVLGVTGEAVKKHIRELWPDLMRERITAYLTEEQVTEIKRKMRLTTKVASALTSLDIERMTLQVIEYHKARIAEMEAENAALRAKSENDRPKVEFFDRAADSADAVSLRDAASTLNMPGWGRNKIFALLREKGVIDGRNIPYREYQDRGLFRVIEQTWTNKEGETHISLKTLVYQKGIAYISGMITRSEKQEAAS